MWTCTRCGKPVPLWEIDLASGICRDCREDDRKAEERVQQEAQAERESTAAARQQSKIDALHGQCPECGGSYRAVKLFGRSSENPLSGVAIDVELVYYTDHDAERGAILQMFSETGYIHAAICSTCHQIVLRGEPIP